MVIEIKVPTLPESVADATLSKWYKKVGDSVARDENLVDLETDKVMLEVPAPKAGVIKEISYKEGDVVTAGQVLAIIEEGAEASNVSTQSQSVKEEETSSEETSSEETSSEETSSEGTSPLDPEGTSSPSVRRLLSEHNINPGEVKGSGKEGRVTKEDVEAHLAASNKSTDKIVATSDREEKRVPMSRLRARIAERLVEVQQTAAILTTFNEINMQPVMDLRTRYKDQFEKKFSTRLGFMSFFTKASIEALQRIPSANASIDGGDIIYHNYCDVGIAIGGPRGLVVPILRNAEQMSMAEIEAAIRSYANKVKDGKLAIEDMQGGTFTITNGGVYGSMMSTPIINPPQTAILGMHNIVERAMVENGEIVVRPMMYVALSYDHRVIDGKESVTFLKTIKECIEDPARLLLEV